MDDEFDDAHARFSSALSSARKRMSAGKVKAAGKNLADAERQLKRMEAEARHSDGLERKRLLESVRKCKSGLAGLRQEFQQRAAGGGSPARTGGARGGAGGSGTGQYNDELFGGPINEKNARNTTSFNAMSDSHQQRARILENSSTQKETDDLLADSHRIANETREIGTAALNSIEDQTDMLIEAKDSVDRAHRETKKAGQLLNTMSRRVCTNKAFLVFIVLLLVGANVLVIYLNRSGGSSGPAPSPPPAPTTPSPASSSSDIAAATAATTPVEHFLTSHYRNNAVRLEGRLIDSSSSSNAAAAAAGQTPELVPHIVSAIKLDPARSLPVPHKSVRQTRPAAATAASDKGASRSAQFEKAVVSKTVEDMKRGSTVMKSGGGVLPPASAKQLKPQHIASAAVGHGGWHLRGNVNKTV
jgi:hypothetical protein